MNTNYVTFVLRSECSNSGKMCDDPGTPVDARQVVTGYEIDSVLYYTCDRKGFKISGPANYTCVYNSNDGTSKWSNNLAQNIPDCKGIYF